MPRELRDVQMSLRITREEKELLDQLSVSLKESRVNIIVSSLKAFAWSMGMGKNEKGDSSCD